jgi:hypothetical protein
MKVKEIKSQSDRTWRVFEVNSEREKQILYLVEVASYGNTHCTCWAFVMGTRRPCKHIEFVLSTIAETDKKELEEKKSSLLSMLCDIVIEHTIADMPRLRCGDPPDQPELSIDNWDECRKEMDEKMREWVKEVFEKKGAGSTKED